MNAAAFPTLREEIDWLLAQQPRLLKLGVMASRLLEATDMLRWLEDKFELHGLEDEGLAERLTRLMIDVLWGLGDETNPRANAARILYGSDPGSMGLPLKTRRRRAAARIVIERSEGSATITIESWRRLWETEVLVDVSTCLAFADVRKMGGQRGGRV